MAQLNHHSNMLAFASYVRSFTKGKQHALYNAVILACTCLVLIGGSAVAQAQADLPATQTGKPVNTSNILHGVDSVNTMGLGLHIEIPLLTLNERGREYTWKYIYNTPTYQIQFFAEPTDQNRAAGLWEVIAPGDVLNRSLGSDNWTLANPYHWYLTYDSHVYQNSKDDTLKLGCTVNGSHLTYETFDNYRLMDPEGTAHPLALSAIYYGTTDNGTSLCPGTPQTSLSSPTLDGTGAYADLTEAGGAFWLKDGTKFTFSPGSTSLHNAGDSAPIPSGVPPGAITVEDANGNIIGPDMMGRAGLTLVLPTTETTETYQYQDSNGAMQQIVFTYAPVSTSTSDCDLSYKTGSAPCYESTGPINLLQSIALPKGLTYTFSYESGGHGDLTGMTLPDGASIAYTYQRISDRGSASGHGGTAYAKDGVSTRVETVNGVSSTWNYVDLEPSNGSAYNVQVTDPSLNCTQYYYAPAAFGLSTMPPVEQSVTYYKGACNSSSTPLKTVTKSYKYEIATLPAGRTTAINTRPYSVVTSLNGGPSMMVQTDFETYTWNAKKYSGFVTGTYTGTRMNPTEVREYDFGASTPLRTTDYAYLHNTGSSTVTAASYQARNIANKLHSTVVYAGSSAGTSLSTTTYDYDNYGSAGITPSGAVQHDTNSGNWGNATSQTVKDNVSGTSYAWTYKYEDTGNMISSTDPLNNKTTYSYADNWSDGHCALASAQQGHIYLTQITNPLNQTVSYSYNSCTGSLASLSDSNTTGNTLPTTLQYDELGRTTSVGYPDGGGASFSYNDTEVPLSMTSTTLLSPSASKTVKKIYDGLGRIIQTQTTDPSSSSGYSYVDTVYNGLDQVVSLSTPYNSKLESTYGVTTYLYDGLGRKTLQTNPDSAKTKVQWAYLQNTITTTDERLNQWKRTSDALGRLTQVLEPSGADKSATMETDYTYDTWGNLKSVQQVGISSTARSRSFGYDNFSRLIQSSNPEAGSVTYSYAAGGSLCAGDIALPCSKTDARGIATSYKYDALNRLVEKTYSNDSSNTPWSCYQYDASSVLNGIGRLASMWTQLGACDTSGYSTKRSILAYDPMGRVWNETQCTLVGCRSANPCSTAGGSHSYSYDLAGNPICAGNGVSSTTGASANPLMFTETYDTVGRLQRITSNWNDSLHPSLLFSAQSVSTPPCQNSATSAYTAFGALANATLGNGVTLNRAFDNRLRTTCMTDTGTAIASPTGGFATVTISGTELTK